MSELTEYLVEGYEGKKASYWYLGRPNNDWSFLLCSSRNQTLLTLTLTHINASYNSLRSLLPSFPPSLLPSTPLLSVLLCSVYPLLYFLISYLILSVESSLRDSTSLASFSPAFSPTTKLPFYFEQRELSSRSVVRIPPLATESQFSGSSRKIQARPTSNDPNKAEIASRSRQVSHGTIVPSW